MATQLEKLIAALRGSGQTQQQPAQPPQMGGMVGQAQGMMPLRNAYTQYAIQAQEQGQQPMPFEQFVQMQGGR